MQAEVEKLKIEIGRLNENVDEGELDVEEDDQGLCTWKERMFEESRGLRALEAKSIVF